jgi:tRNA (guanine-N7-)-methyltransferase
VGKNKLARWSELGTFRNVFQPEIGAVAGKDHPVKGTWHNEVFRNQNPIILELGCGKGEYTVGLATRFPSNNYAGIDIKGARMWRGAKTASEQNLQNVAFLRTRIEFINSFFREDEVDEIWITFPDPHPGPGNSNKRLTSQQFLKRYLSFLKNNGIIHLKTDNLELYTFTESVIRKNNLELLFATNDLYTGNPETIKMPSDDNFINNHSERAISLFENILSIKTHYEKQFLLKGMKINFLSFRLKKDSFLNDDPDKK